MLKLIDYIKHTKLIFLIDSHNTHSFILYHIVQGKHYYIYDANNF